VGQKVANELGLYDMSWNVFEWCWDSVGSPFRRIRGGSWNDNYEFCAVAHLGSKDFPSARDGYIGFRLARSLGN
jgi:formylglycine-generating enzyme required for sulfatase activity